MSAAPASASEAKPAAAAAELSSWLASHAFSDLETSLRGATLDELGNSLAKDRAAFLSELKRRGVDRLPQRQALANALARWAKTLPLVIKVDCGLCNRLRALLSHRLIAAEAGRLLTVAWTPCDECPGRFLDCFAALPGVELVDALRASVARPLQLRSAKLANSLCAGVKGAPERETECYRALEPTAAVSAEVERVVAACGGRGAFVSLHIRRTDHYTLELGAAGGSRLGTDEEHDAWLARLPGAPMIFLATDCARTRRRFAETYGDRLRTHGRIGYAEDGGEAASEAAAVVEKDEPAPRVALRQTTLQSAVVDLFACAEASAFRGSTLSSFSDTIVHLRRARGLASAEDAHTMRDPPADADCVYWRAQLEARPLALDVEEPRS